MSRKYAKTSLIKNKKKSINSKLMDNTRVWMASSSKDKRLADFEFQKWIFTVPIPYQVFVNVQISNHVDYLKKIVAVRRVYPENTTEGQLA